MIYLGRPTVPRPQTPGLALQVRVDRSDDRSMSKSRVRQIAAELNCPASLIMLAVTAELFRLADPAIGLTARNFEIRIRRAAGDDRVWAGESSAWPRTAT